MIFKNLYHNLTFCCSEGEISGCIQAWNYHVVNMRLDVDLKAIPLFISHYNPFQIVWILVKSINKICHFYPYSSLFLESICKMMSQQTESKFFINIFSLVTSSISVASVMCSVVCCLLWIIFAAFGIYFFFTCANIDWLPYLFIVFRIFLTFSKAIISFECLYKSYSIFVIVFNNLFDSCLVHVRVINMPLKSTDLPFPNTELLWQVINRSFMPLWC